MTELEVARAREAALRDVLRIVARSRDDDAPVFDAILKSACDLCDAPFAGLYLVDAARREIALVASRGARTAYLTGGDRRWPIDDPASVGVAIRECRVEQADDIRDTEAYRTGNRQRVEAADIEGIRTFLAVPLIQDGQAIGCIGLYRRDVSRFSDDAVALVETFAEQAAIAIENVRQFREVQARLERERASAEVLEIISRSRTDTAPVFSAILESAARLCAAPHALLLLPDNAGTHLELAASNSADSRFIDNLRETPHDLSNKRSGATLAYDTGKTQHVPDVRELFPGEGRAPQLSFAADIEGMRTVLLVPLRIDGRSVGVISVYKLEVAPFTDDEIALVESFAAQAVIAIENVRQFREVQARLERERATGRILDVISRSRDDETPVFEAIVESAQTLCHARMTALILATPEDKLQRLVAYRDIKPETVEMFASGQMPVDGDKSYAARSLIEGRVIHLPDMADSDLYRANSPVVRTMVDEIGIRSVLFAPLLAQGRGIGALTVFRYEVDPFDDRTIELIETFAAQAVIAIENVRQFREVQTRLEREAALREILQIISRSRDDEMPVLQVIVQNAARICGSAAVGLHLLNAARTHSRLACVSDADKGVFEIGQEFDLSGPHQTPTTIREARVINVPDTTKEPLYLARDPVRVKLVEVDGVRSRLSVPLLKDGVAFGCINLNRHELRPFSEDEVALIETFAAQAVIAIDNVRQFREVQDRLEREKASREVLQVISASRTDPAPVFEVILRNAAHLSGAPLANLCILDAARSHWHLVAHFGEGLRHLAVGKATSLADSQLLPAVAMRTGQVAQIDDLTDTELYRQGDPGRVAMVDVEGMRTILCVPLLRKAEAIGCITLFRREVKAFSVDEITLVETFAAQAVIAIENVRQFREVQALNAELGDRVEKQVGEIERMGRLKRFLPAAVADAVVSSGSDGLLGSHRALIATLFCDIRGFTAFCETAEPEETIELLQTYHEAMGELIAAHGAGVDHRMGDGIMVIFNDPLPCDDPVGSALRLALAMREGMAGICAQWKRLGYRLGFGVGISLGYATVGMVGSSGRFEYTASGTAVNLAARLCDHAGDGDILLSPRAHAAVEDRVEAENLGDLALKGIREPVEVFRVLRDRHAT